MEITISSKAQKWYQDNLELVPGDGIHFYGKVYGKTNVHEGFSLAFSKAKPQQPYYQVQYDGISYFYNDEDVWFFEGLNLAIEYDAQTDSPIYTFSED